MSANLDQRPAPAPASPQVRCDYCGELHPVGSIDQFNGAQLYAVVCTADQLTDFYTAERFE